VLSIYDIKIGGGEYYFVTEFADRGSLKDYAATKPDHKLAPLEALEIAIAIGHGLDTAHDQGIIHRDIKPSNILLFSQADGGIIAKLADFGIARIPDRRLTQTGWFVGTPLYASPEQLAAEMVDARSDIYSWGAVLFEMLTGKVLKELLADGSTDNSAMLDRFAEMFFIAKSVPPQFVAVLQKALHSDARRRYQTAREMLDDLESIRPALSGQAQGAIDLTGPPHGQTLGAKARAWLRRNRTKLAFSGALLIVLLGLAAILGPLWMGGIVSEAGTPTSTLSAGAHTLTATTTPTRTLTPTRTPSPTATTSLTSTQSATITPALRRTPTRTTSPTRTFTPAPLPTEPPVLASPTLEVPPFPTRAPDPTATLPPFPTRTFTTSPSTP
jgi:serine/threonine-protein kinase